MDGGFPYGDLIIIAAIAAFILLRYRAMLGETRDDDGAPRSGEPGISGFEKVIKLPISRAITLATQADDFGGAYGSLAADFVAMRAIDREFTPDEFLQGAKTAYEMVMTAFSKHDHDTLKMLLSAEMYQSFALSLSDAQKEGRLHDTTLVAITKAEITKARLVDKQATITVAFVSEQIHLIRDPDGTILEGDVSQQHSVEDEWVFTRTLSSTSPDWTIIET